MGRTYSTQELEQIHIKFWTEKLEGREILRDLSVDGRTELKLALKK
jgi:hypothetical protein